MFIKTTFYFSTKGLSFLLAVDTIKICKRTLNSSQLATALRPFYFAVHPDLFGQHPQERTTNEDSLKRLTVFLETVKQNKKVRPTKFTFYLRNRNDNVQPLTVGREGASRIRSVDITLKSHDLHSTVRHILSSCNLSTSYVDAISKTTSLTSPVRMPANEYNENDLRTHFKSSRTDLQDKWDVTSQVTHSLESWLRKNADTARSKLHAMQPIREETEKLREELCALLKLKGIHWSCGWGITHFRGCLQSLNALRVHHPDVLRNLEGRILVFGSLTGVSLDGHIILSSADVRNSWLELIKRAKEYDVTLERIPAVEKTVSRVLRDIKVVRRKFQPVVTAKNYETQLRTLSATIADYWVRNNFPLSWPVSLQTFQLVVECDAGPLMLSPTGQFIVPSSCPAVLIVNFMTDNLVKARQQLTAYESNKHLEEELHLRCVAELRLAGLNKDDNVTPDRMIECCQRLLEHQHSLLKHVEGARINITHFYSVLQDGDMCLPWNWDR